MAQPSIIELDNVTRRYRVGPATVTALQGVALRVAEGEFVVPGPSGCGKTTLLNSIGAPDTPSDRRFGAGRVRNLA